MSKIKNRKVKSYPQQQGFVLVLAIVLLTVLTLIGVSSMNSASIELKSAANAQQHQIAFNAVQSVIEYAVSDAVVKPLGATPLLDFQVNNKALEQVLAYSLVNANALDAKLKYVDCLRGAPGNSLEEDKAFSYNFYAITATGSNATGTAFSQQVQAVRNTSASCEN